MDVVEVGSATDGLNLPYNSEAEQAVLGAILMDPEALASAMEILPSGDYFYLSTHKQIYNAMIELFTLSKPVDIVTVLNSINGKREAPDGDIKNYLMNLADFCPSISRVRDYAIIVRDKYLLRSLIV